MDQINRIQEMEKLFDETNQALNSFEQALESYFQIQSSIEKLDSYYTGPLWIKDFEDDCNGKLPKNLKRGILSEDSLYHLLERNSEILKKLNQIKKRD